MSVPLLSAGFLSKGQYQIFSLDLVSPPGSLLIENKLGQANSFVLGGAPLVMTPSAFSTNPAIGDPTTFADPTPIALSGTVTVTQGSQAVVGVGTAFLTQLGLGSVVALADGLVLGRVAAIADNTHFSLVFNWAGVTASGVTLYNATPAQRTIAPYQSLRFNLPIGDVRNRNFTFIQAVVGPLQFIVDAPDAQIAYVRDSKTEFLL